MQQKIGDKLNSDKMKFSYINGKKKYLEGEREVKGS